MSLNKELIAALVGGLGGAAQGYNQEQARKSNLMGDLTKMSLSQMLQEQGPLYKARVASLEEGRKEKEKYKEYILGTGERRTEREAAKRDIATTLRRGAEDRYIDTAEKEPQGFLGAFASEPVGKKGFQVSDLIRGPAKFASTGIQSLLGSKPLYSRGGEYAEEGVFAEPEKSKMARQSLEELMTRESIQKTSPGIKDIEEFDTPEAWAENQYYKLMNKSVDSPDDPMLGLQTGIVESSILDFAQKKMVMDYLDQKLTADEIIAQDPDMEPILQAITGLVQGL